MGELMYDSPLEHVVTLATDLLVFLFNSICYWCETIWLTVLPARYRKLKVNNSHRTEIAFQRKSTNPTHEMCENSNVVTSSRINSKSIIDRSQMGRDGIAVAFTLKS